GTRAASQDVAASFLQVLDYRYLARLLGFVVPDAYRNLNREQAVRGRAGIVRRYINEISLAARIAELRRALGRLRGRGRQDLDIERQYIGQQNGLRAQLRRRRDR